MIAGKLRGGLLAVAGSLVLLVAGAEVPGDAAGPPSGASAALAPEAGELANGGSDAVARFRGRPLFTLYAQLGALTPEDRARAIEQRLERIADGDPAVVGRIRRDERQGATDVIAGDELVLSVTDVDAAPVGRTRQQLAADYAVALRGVLAEEFRGRSARGILTGIGIALAATLALAVLVGLLQRYGPRIRQALDGLARTYLRDVRIGNEPFLTVDQVARSAGQVAAGLRALILIVAFFVYVEVVLSVFPWTEALSRDLLAGVRGAIGFVVLGVLDYLPNVLYIAAIVVAAHYLLRIGRTFFEAVDRGTIRIAGFYPEWALPSFKIVRFLGYALTAVVVFPYLPGSSSPAFQGVSLFLGLLFSLGSTSAIANIVAGVVLTYMRPFRVGDRVKIADTMGDVVDKDLLVVRIRTIKNVEVTVPNAMVLSNHIVNFSSCARDPGLILHTSVTIGYDVPWRQVHELLVAAAGRTEGLMGEPKPFVLQTALNDFYVAYELNAYTDQPARMAQVYSDLHQAIQDAFNAAGVEIMSPHYMAARDGNQTTVPPDHLPEGYVAPAFRVAPAGPAPGS